MDPAPNPHLTGAGGWGLCNVQHIPHWFPCRKGKTSPLGEAWGNPADFEVLPETPSLLLAQSSKDKPASGRVSLRASSSTFPALTSPSGSCFHLGSYWFCHRIKTTKGKESPSKYTKVKASALESFGRMRQKRNSEGIIWALFYTWRPEAGSWDPHSSDLCKTMGSPNPMGQGGQRVRARPLHWVLVWHLYHTAMPA